MADQAEVAQYVTDLITKFWDDEFEPSYISKFAAILRNFGAPEHLSDVEVISNCKHNPIDQTCFLDIMAPRALKCAYRKGHTFVSHDYIRKQFEESLPVFAGKAPLNHPFHDFFAGEAPHVGYMDKKIQPLRNIWLFFEASDENLSERHLFPNMILECCRIVMSNPDTKARPFLRGNPKSISPQVMRKCRQLLQDVS